MNSEVDLGIRALVSAVHAGQTTTDEILRIVDEAIKRADARHLNVLVTQATALPAKERLVTGGLSGVPFVVKDMFDTAGIQTTYGSQVFSGHLPETSATVVTQLLDAGAILVGKANQHEFAWGVTSQNPHWGRVGNPKYPGLTSGGSSGGTAAALAAGVCTFGLGTDTGGSVRIPAACCGVVGFRPLQGSVCGEGMFPLAPSFDVVGPMANTVRDVAEVFEVIGPPRSQEKIKIRGSRAGVVAESPDIDRLQALGVRLQSVRFPDLTDLYETVQRYEAWRVHAELLNRYGEQYGSDVASKLERASEVSPTEYASAKRHLLRVRLRLRDRLDSDFLVGPTLGGEAPSADCDEATIREAMLLFTAPYSALDMAALAIGNLQIAGWDNWLVLTVGLAWEENVEITPRRA